MGIIYDISNQNAVHIFSLTTKKGTLFSSMWINKPGDLNVKGDSPSHLNQRRLPLEWKQPSITEKK